MSLIPFVTSAEYCTWAYCSLADLPSDMARQIKRASELVYYSTHMAWVVPVLTADVPTAIKDATCAQLEYVLNEVGEDYDRNPMPTGASMTVGGVTQNWAPAVLAPRARRILLYNGYLNRHIKARGSMSLREDDD